MRTTQPRQTQQAQRGKPRAYRACRLWKRWRPHAAWPVDMRVRVYVTRTWPRRACPCHTFVHGVYIHTLTCIVAGDIAKALRAKYHVELPADVADTMFRLAFKDAYGVEYEPAALDAENEKPPAEPNPGTGPVAKEEVEYPDENGFHPDFPWTYPDQEDQEEADVEVVDVESDMSDSGRERALPCSVHNVCMSLHVCV